MKQVTIYKVIGYKHRNEMMDFMDAVTIWVYAESGDEAIKKAKAKGVKKENWKVVEVVEKYEEVETKITTK